MLVVDDEPIVCEFLVRLIEAHGLQCVSAPSVEAGLDVLAAGAIDIALIDYSVGEETSLDLVSAAHEADTPCIVIAADKCPDTASACHDAGARSVLHKPLQIQNILDALDHVTG